MKPLTPLSIMLLLAIFSGHCQRPPPLTPKAPVATAGPVGGGCDGCELMYVGTPDNIAAVDTSAGFGGPGQQLLVKGTVYRSDGKTPADGVVLYYWQTDHRGLYSPEEGGDERARRHGRLRGWIRPSSDGKYALYTVRPAPYPGAAEPAHIHMSVKEPAIANEYYIDDFLFDDDPLLTAERRKGLQQRGGAGSLKIVNTGRLQVATRDIILGQNIPGYPGSGAKR